MSVRIELFTVTGCSGCGSAVRALEDVTAALGAEHFELRIIDVVEEIDYAVSMGVLSTPTIVVNERLIFASVPTKRQLKRELETHLRQNHVEAGFRDG